MFNLHLFLLLLTAISLASFYLYTCSLYQNGTSIEQKQKIINVVVGTPKKQEDLIIVKQTYETDYILNDKNVSKIDSTLSETTLATRSFSNMTLDESITNPTMTKQWLNQLSAKIECLRLHTGSVYHYHTRKAAGTSIRDVLTMVSAKWTVPYYETEGIVLNNGLLDLSGALLVTSLRDPISRILSLYWYEHVGWYDGVLKQTSRCKTMMEWVQSWRDGTIWKNNFMEKNPESVYVEIENYYVKMLSGWHGRRKRNDDGTTQVSVVTAADYEKAKTVLQRFDLVLLSEWMDDSTQIEAMNALFPGRKNIGVVGHKVKGDHHAKVRLSDKLAPDEAKVREILISINQYDIQLFEYAQSLMAYRLKLIPPAVEKVKGSLGLDPHRNSLAAGGSTTAIERSRTSSLRDEGSGSGVTDRRYVEHLTRCRALKSEIPANLKLTAVGIFQPPGHKGPF